MSLFRGIIGGAMMGGGQALQVVARDEELARQRMALEAAREKAANDRAVALEAMRHNNNVSLHKLDHGARKELEGQRQEHEGGILDKRITAEDARSKAERESREGISRDDNTARLEATRISAGASRHATDTQKEIAEGKLGALAKVPDADRRMLDVLKEEGKQVQAAILKQKSDPLYDPKSPGVAELNSQLEGVRARQQQILEKNGLAPASAPDKPAANGPSWDKITPEQRSAITDRMKGMKGPELEKAVRDAERLGMPADVLKSYREQKPASKPESKGVIAEQQKPGGKEVELTPREKDMQREEDLKRERDASNKATTEKIQSYTLERIKTMPVSELAEIEALYGTRLSGKQRAAINARLR